MLFGNLDTVNINWVKINPHLRYLIHIFRKQVTNLSFIPELLTRNKSKYFVGSKTETKSRIFSRVSSPEDPDPMNFGLPDPDIMIS